MENETIPKQMVWLTEGNSAVAKAVLDMSPEDQQRILNAEVAFQRVQLKPLTEEELQTVREAVDANGRPADDVMSYVFAQNEMSRKARERRAAEQRAREADAQAAAREAQLRAEREEYLRPADRGKLAQQLQGNHSAQNAPVQPTHQFTDAELDAMSGDEYRKRVLRDIRVEDRQGSSGIVLRPERTGERRERKIKFSPEELEAQKSRQRVIDRDKAEGRKVKQDLEQAQREKQEKRGGK